MSISSETILFDWRVAQIEHHAVEIGRCAWVFDHGRSFDTALQKLDLRRSARMLREAADRLDNIERQICGPATAFPEAAE